MDPQAVMGGEVWRLFSHIFVPSLGGIFPSWIGAAFYLMFLVWLLARDSELMGEWRSKPWSQILLLGATLLMISLPIMWLFAG
jgi:hypothetical protein